jgi:hypothetical protein
METGTQADREGNDFVTKSLKTSTKEDEGRFGEIYLNMKNNVETVLDLDEVKQEIKTIYAARNIAGSRYKHINHIRLLTVLRKRACVMKEAKMVYKYKTKRKFLKNINKAIKAEVQHLTDKYLNEKKPKITKHKSVNLENVRVMIWKKA